MNNEEGQVPWQTENIRRTSYSQSSSVFYNTWSYRKFYCCSYDGTYILVINETYLEIVLQRCFSEKVFWKIFRRAPMLKFNFNKATWQLYWNHTSALVLHYKFATHLSKFFFIGTPLESCFSILFFVMLKMHIKHIIKFKFVYFVCLCFFCLTKIIWW